MERTPSIFEEHEKMMRQVNKINIVTWTIAFCIEVSVIVLYAIFG